MKNVRWSLFGGLVSVGLASALILAGCGTPVCVGGVGQCGYDPAKVPGPGSSGSSGATGDVLLSCGAAPIVTVNQKIVFMAAGGTGPYTYIIRFPTGTAATAIGSLAADGTFTAATFLTTGAGSKQKLVVYAKDRNGVISNDQPIWVSQP